MKVHELRIAVVAAVLGGCVPYPLQETPRLTGQVADAVTKQPVVDARLHYEEFPERVIATGSDGQFEFPAISKWQLVPIGPLDRFGARTLVVHALGYQPASRRVPIMTREPYLLDVPLTPETTSPVP